MRILQIAEKIGIINDSILKLRIVAYIYRKINNTKQTSWNKPI